MLAVYGGVENAAKATAAAMGDRSPAARSAYDNNQDVDEVPAADGGRGMLLGGADLLEERISVNTSLAASRWPSAEACAWRTNTPVNTTPTDLVYGGGGPRGPLLHRHAGRWWEDCTSAPYSYASSATSGVGGVGGGVGSVDELARHLVVDALATATHPLARVSATIPSPASSSTATATTGGGPSASSSSMFFPPRAEEASQQQQRRGTRDYGTILACKLPDIAYM
jgi:hypothetical protein